MNYIVIAGHLGADPEVRFTSTGKKVTALRVATRTRKGQKDETIWYKVTIWGEQFDKLMPHLKKGSAVIINGELQLPEIFTDKEGKPRMSLEVWANSIQFSPFGKPGGQQEGASSHQSYQTPISAPQPVGVTAGQGQTFDDEVPF